MRNFVSIVACLALALTVDSSSTNASKGIAEGEEWLKWNAESRLLYVSAYLTGYDRGFSEGCKMAEEVDSSIKSTGLPGEKCISREPSHSKNLETYVDLITEFYTTYPKDRYVTIRTVLNGLSDARHLSLQQIHLYSGQTDQAPKP
jgi:hypothetical protein